MSILMQWLRALFGQPEPELVPIPVRCNFDNNYYGDRVCDAERRRRELGRTR